MSRKTVEQIRAMLDANDKKHNTPVTPHRTAITDMILDMYAVIEKHVPALKATMDELNFNKESPEYKLFGPEKETIARTVTSVAVVAGSFVLTNEDITDQQAMAIMLTAQMGVLMKSVADNDPRKLGAIISGLANAAEKHMKQDNKKPEIH